MKVKCIAIGIAIFFLNITAYSQTNDQIVIGEKFKINSQTLGEDRTYWVSLPDAYQDELQSYKNYPVLILLDGPTHFHSASGMIKFRSTGNTDRRDMPEMIIVGISNVSRERDFTPDKVVTRRENKTGGGAKFLKFLEAELIPALDKTYRTIPYRILVGHSLGGLLTTHAYLQLRVNSMLLSRLILALALGTKML